MCCYYLLLNDINVTKSLQICAFLTLFNTGVKQFLPFLDKSTGSAKNFCRSWRFERNYQRRQTCTLSPHVSGFSRKSRTLTKVRMFKTSAVCGKSLWKIFCLPDATVC